MIKNLLYALLIVFSFSAIGIAGDIPVSNFHGVPIGHFDSQFNSAYNRNAQQNIIANKQVIVERKQLQFEDLGIRVIGVPVDLLGLRYYYHVNRDENFSENDVSKLITIVQQLQAEIADLKAKVGNGNDVLPEPEAPPVPPNVPDVDDGAKTLPEPQFNVTTVLVPEDVKLVFKNKCYSCHKGESAENDFDISLASSFSVSNLWKIHDAVLGINDFVGKKMPLSRSALTDEELTLVTRWVQDNVSK